MKIGIITICTGKYDKFFDGLYESMEEHFLKGHEKTYYVFSDGNIREEDNVIKVAQPKLGWPFDTMLRFHMFNSIADKLAENEYVFFFNANMKALKSIGEEVIPGPDNNYLMGAHHPFYFKKGPNQFPYDRNKNCSCFIPKGKGKFYAQGCFNGGRTEEFMEMSKVLADNLDLDDKKNIIPLWHDESQLNWYYKDRNPLMLSYNYIFPENTKLAGDKIMVQLDKAKHGGHNFLRT